jgi:hypothetical protein
MEVQQHSSRVGVTDVELVYASSFLSICCQWEGLLESSLLEVVVGSPSAKPGRGRLATFRGRRHLRDVLLYPNKDYIGLETLKRAIGLATLFVPNGKPFSEVSEANQTYLHQAVVVRNAIAHQSDFAIKKFRASVPGVASLPTSKRTPGAFLRHEFRQDPTQTRFELYVTAFKSAASEIRGAW